MALMFSLLPYHLAKNVKVTVLLGCKGTLSPEND